MLNGYVYKCTNCLNGKVYIGITTKTIDRRKKEHINSSFNIKDNTYKTHFHSALRKYGVENFKWEIIETLQDSIIEELLSHLRNLEIKYIKFYDSFENGYNLTPGGELTFRGDPKIINLYTEDGKLLDNGTIGFLASKYDLDISAICKVCNREYNFSGQFNGQRLVFRYENDSFTDIDKEKLKKLNKGNKKGKKIVGYSYENGEFLFEFNSAKEAATSLNLNYRAIANCACGKYKYSGKIGNIKITWKYK